VKKLLIITILGLLLFGFKPVQAFTIRILILKNADKIEIFTPKSLEIAEKQSPIPIFIGGSEGARCTITLSGGNILINKVRIGHSPILVRSIPPAALRVNGRRYRGELEIRKTGDSLKAINIIDLEGYLYGVIRREISPNWPMEAVKAQAVAARTFVHANLGRHENEGYDLCSSYHCQVYGGMESEEFRSIEAVDITEGEILTYNGKLINAIYHATCGGHTADTSLVWAGKELHYLKGVICPFCKESPHYSWCYQISLDKIKAALEKNGYALGPIHNISPSKKDKAGRIGELIINHGQKKTKMNASAFRFALGPSNLRSTLFELNNTGKAILFQGFGWGHGVGMCQWGAKKMAELGFNYKEILGYYYPDTQISTCSLDLVSAPQRVSK